ncbi:hypothetical protein LEP1GSC047_0551 [Leptospira inadai serovar Lyme str. 10]|uniref:Uncharacterized protein n=1 Tax=Leptospira inadai serovar Lyme str. 10 TaxID=1049790 RepID=V6HT62_9LEPT|nr:hypothetical protein [Leptospira inadai]EQA35854.1 hypothetical protein LEP1GSC047_0551 [Leptospira inadai serovar Lyme str. 10]
MKPNPYAALLSAIDSFNPTKPGLKEWMALFQMFLFEKNNPGLIAGDLISRIQFFGNN